MRICTPRLHWLHLWNHSSSSISAMPQKWKASAAHIANLQVARDTLSGKQQKSTPVDSDFSEEKTSDDEIVWFNHFSKTTTWYYRWTMMALGSFVSQNEQKTRILWHAVGTCCYYLTFRGKLIKIKLYDKHKTSHECQEQCYKEFLLTKILDLPSAPEISMLGDAPHHPTSPPIFLCHLCIFLLIVASPRRSALAAPIPESDDHVM